MSFLFRGQVQSTKGSGRREKCVGFQKPKGPSPFTMKPLVVLNVASTVTKTFVIPFPIPGSLCSLNFDCVPIPNPNPWSSLFIEL